MTLFYNQLANDRTESTETFQVLNQLRNQFFAAETEHNQLTGPLYVDRVIEIAKASEALHPVSPNVDVECNAIRMLKEPPSYDKDPSSFCYSKQMLRFHPLMIS